MKGIFKKSFKRNAEEEGKDQGKQRPRKAAQPFDKPFLHTEQYPANQKDEKYDVYDPIHRKILLRNFRILCVYGYYSTFLYGCR